MAELAGTVNATFFPVQLTAVAVARGTRLTLAATGGLVAASAIGVRGDYVADQAGAASEFIAAASLQEGAILAVIASEAVVNGDTAYSAASGKVSKTSGGGAVLLGKWVQDTAQDALGRILVQTVA